MRVRFLPLALCAVIGMGLAGCALGPVEPDPVQADARADLMKRDCMARGGVWNEEGKTCLAADPIRR
jgi:hypothetical protein